MAIAESPREKVISYEEALDAMSDIAATLRDQRETIEGLESEAAHLHNRLDLADGRLAECEPALERLEDIQDLLHDFRQGVVTAEELLERALGVRP